jgi:hypothetical protein
MLQHNLLPRNVQRKLRNGETVVAEHHPAATVLWAEVVGLPRIAAEVPPLELVRGVGGPSARGRRASVLCGCSAPALTPQAPKQPCFARAAG